MTRFKGLRGFFVVSLLILGATVFVSAWVVRVHADQTSVASIGLPQTESCLSNPNYSNGDKLCVGLTATLSKDLAERDSSHDFYGVALRLWNLNSTYNAIVSMDAYLSFSTNGGSPLGLQPQAGTIGSQQTIDLGAAGVSLSLPIYVPDQVITTDTSTGVLTSTVHWEVRGDTGLCCNTIFTNYGELGVIFSVAEDASVNVSASAGFFCPDGGLCSLPAPYPLKQTVFGSMSYTPPDFAFAGPSSINGPAGQKSTYTLTLTSQTSFQDTVYLSDTGLPSGFTTIFSPSFVVIGGGSAAYVNYSITVPKNPPSPYFWTLTARTVSSTQLVHNWTVSSNPDFSISASPAFMPNIPGYGYGCWGVSQLIIQSLGYSGSLSLSSSQINDPTGTYPVVYSQIRTSYAPGTATITNGGTVAGTLSVWAPSSHGVLGQTYSVNVGVAGSGLTHQITVQVSFAAGDNSASYIQCNQSGGGGGGKPN